jgi:hypothetical protein
MKPEGKKTGIGLGASRYFVRLADDRQQVPISMAVVDGWWTAQKSRLKI